MHIFLSKTEKIEIRGEDIVVMKKRKEIIRKKMMVFYLEFKVLDKKKVNGIGMDKKRRESVVIIISGKEKTGILI